MFIFPFMIVTEEASEKQCLVNFCHSFTLLLQHDTHTDQTHTCSAGLAAACVHVFMCVWAITCEKKCMQNTNEPLMSHQREPAYHSHVTELAVATLTATASSLQQGNGQEANHTCPTEAPLHNRAGKEKGQQHIQDQVQVMSLDTPDGM